ncbi:MAG: bifunctional methylenetetrahydrofolate dehydrogenase/methenyltetrahydrofolate cyclohydrolase, partial [Candidatus Diapherotrites archaeon]
MVAKILDGNAIAKKVFETAKSHVNKLKEYGINPKL